MTSPADQNSSMRRFPQQARSRLRVEAMIDAAEKLIGEHGYEALTTTQIAEAAGVTVATLYQFFPDKRSIAQVLAQRYVDQYVAGVESASSPITGGDWWDDIEQSWALTARMNRDIPAFSRMQFGDPIDLHLLDEHLTNSEVVIDRLSKVHDGAHPLDDPEIRTVMTVITTAISPLYSLAFRDSPEGDPKILAEIRTMIRGYLIAKFADRMPPDDDPPPVA